MKKIILVVGLVAVLLTGLILPGCIRRNLAEENGPITETTYANTGFTGVEVGSAMKFDVSYGADYSVKITAGKNLFDHIKVTQTGDTLKVRIEGWNISWWWGHSTPKVTIIMPELRKIVASGATDGSVSGFKSDKDLELNASGASHIDIDMEAGDLTAVLSGASNIKGTLIAAGSDIDLSGASDLDLTGTGGNLKLEASGASTAALRYFPVKDADVTLSGASDGSIDVSGKMDVDLSGASSLNYYGNPTLGNTSVTGASDLKHKS